MTTLALVDTGAEFSEPDRLYRYRLWRRWAEGPMLMVIGLNPSTADETQDDPTIRRCIGYAKAWGFAGLEMGNLFGFRSTDPRALRAHHTGALQDMNVAHLGATMATVLGRGGAILAAWGNHAHGRTAPFLRLCALGGVGVACLGLTGMGEPKHPLYLRADAKPIPFLGDGGRLCAGLPDGTGHGYHVEGAP